MAGSKTITFSGKGLPGDLLDPDNWIGDVVPTINDTALITMNVGAPVPGTFSVNNVMLLGAETITFDGTLDTAGVGACKGLMVCDGATAIFAPGAVLNDGNVLIVGNDAVGTLVAKGTGTTQSVINSVTGNIGKQDDGVGTVNINGGIWNNSGHLFIGDEGSGTLNVLNDGSVSVGGSVDMAFTAGSTGKMTISSGGSVTIAGALRIGTAATPIADPASTTPVVGATLPAGSGAVLTAAGGAVSTQGVATVSVGVGSSLTVEDTLEVGAGSKLSIAGGIVTGGATDDCIVVQAGGLITGFGTLSGPDGTAIDDQGIIRATGGSLEVNGNICGAGSVQIGANSTAILTGSKLGLASIAFIGADSTLSLAHGAVVTAAISGFGLGDIISMASIDAVSFNPANNIMTISDQGVQVDKIHLVGNFAGDTFSVTQSAAGGLIALQT